MNKKLITRILLALIVLTIFATVILYFVYQNEKPMMAFYLACSGGLFVINFSITLFFIRKNFK